MSRLLCRHSILIALFIIEQSERKNKQGRKGLDCNQFGQAMLGLPHPLDYRPQRSAADIGMETTKRWPLNFVVA
jgi:hypothetical protein